MTVRVVARFTAKPDTIAAARDLLTSIILPTRIEQGCITYQLLQNEADPSDFTFIEEWTSDEDLDAHLQSDHINNVVKRADELFSSPPDIRRYRLLG